jgi:FSR family fosmidomycin resistance protein-like MFS transporter
MNIIDYQHQKSKNNDFKFSSLITISLAHMLHDIYSSFLSPVIPLLINKFSISYSFTSLLSVIQRLPSVISPFVGLLADRISLRYLVIISPSITGIVMSLLGVAPHYIVIVILLLIMGISSSLFHVPAPVMIRKVVGERKGMGMSFYMLGGEIARTTGPLIIVGAVSLWTFEGTWRLIPFCIAGSFMLFLRLRKIKVYSEFEKREKILGRWKTFKSFLPYLIPITIFLFFNTFIRQIFRFYLPTYMDIQGESLWTGGIALSVFHFSGAAGSLICGTYSDKIGRTMTLIIMAVLTPVIMWLFVHIHIKAVNFILLIALGVVSVGTGPVLLAFINDIPTDRMAFLNGLYISIAFLTSSADIMIVGIISDWIGLENTFKLCTYLGILAIPAVFYISTKKYKSQFNSN